MANTETLIVELDASTDKLDKKINKTDDSFEKLDGSVKKTDKSFVNFASDAKKLGATVLAVGAAIGVAVAEASAFARELSVASNRTGDSVERLQELAFISCARSGRSGHLRRTVRFCLLPFRSAERSHERCVESGLRPASF